MREIKYRFFWNGAMYDVDLLDLARGTVGFQVPTGAGDTTTGGFVSIAEGTLRQFTGLYDRNGVEIYEGDLVRFPYGYTREMTFIEGCFRLKDTPYQQDYDKAEVIGSHWENPDLLTTLDNPTH